MFISVIVPTCNRNDLLSKCLDLLAPAYQTINEQYEVIVTDDSKDNMAKSLMQERYSWANWIPGPKKGPASNRNNGASQANGSWIVFIDDDCLPDKEILNTYKETILANPDVLAFEGAILPDDWGKLKEDMSECPVNTDGGCFWSANICVTKAIFQKINGFDENFLIAAQEDQDIYVRILKETKVVFVKEAIVVHPVRKITLSKKLRQIPVATKNWYLYEKKHNPQTVSRVRYMFFKFLNDFTRSTVKDISKGKMKSAVLNLSYLFVGVPIYLKASLKNIGK